MAHDLNRRLGQLERAIPPDRPNWIVWGLMAIRADGTGEPRPSRPTGPPPPSGSIGADILQIADARGRSTL
jgi:hypothetical protein